MGYGVVDVLDPAPRVGNCSMLALEPACHCRASLTLSVKSRDRSPSLASDDWKPPRFRSNIWGRLG